MNELSPEQKKLCYLAGVGSSVRMRDFDGFLVVKDLTEDLRGALGKVAEMNYPTNQVERLGSETARILRSKHPEKKGEYDQKEVASAVQDAARNILSTLK